jgi:RHS repeat-associated protein
MQMQPASSPAMPETPLAVLRPGGEKPHQGFLSRNPALYQGPTVCNSTTALGLRGQAKLNRVGSRCTGKERDAESGNDYFLARYYSSAMGRFMSPDWSAKREPVPYAKLDNPQSLNLYAYVFNNPLSHIDADGHATWFDPKGKKIGTDGVNDGGVVIAQRNSVAFSPDHSIIDMAASGTPMYSFSKEEIGAMKDSVARTLAPSTTGDMKGGFHEEGFTEKGGVITPAPAGPGYKPGDSEAHVNLPIGPSTTLEEHTHPSGSDATFGGTKFDPMPSGPDMRNAANAQFLSTTDITHVQVSAANSDVHVYTGSGVQATFNLSGAP